MSENTHQSAASTYQGGPHGLGDPESKYLRRVEIDVLIPKKMRAIARAENCINEVADFDKCVLQNSYKLIFKCRSENSALWGCLDKYYQDPDFRAKCTNQYLQERSEYRATGISKKDKIRMERSIH